MDDMALGGQPKGLARTYAAWALLVASPFLLLLCISLAIGKNALTGLPVWTDELDYWRAVYSWLHVGPAAGYSGIAELHAPLGTLSVHGLSPVLLYALPAAVLGWSYSSITLINALWVSAGALAFCLLAKPRAGTALAVGAMFALYAPVVLYAATSMTELANYGLLLFYMAFVGWLLRARGQAGTAGRKPRAAAGWPALLFGSLTTLLLCAYRITYIGLWIPLLLVACDFRWSGRMALYGVLALLLSAGAYVLMALYTSPFASGFLYNFLRTGSFGLSKRMFLSHAKANLLDYFVRAPGNEMERLQRVLYCTVAGLSLLGSLLRVRREGGRLRLRFGFSGFSLLVFLTLFIPFAIIICFYETNDWSDYRTLAPFLWLAAAAYALRGRRFVPAVFLAGSAAILAVLLTLPSVGMYADTARFAPPALTAEGKALCEAVPYDPAATDPYENAVRTDLFTLETVSALDPGLGLQTGWFTPDTVGKSRWLLTDFLKAPLEGYELVFKNSAGSVYRLLDAAGRE